MGNSTGTDNLQSYIINLVHLYWLGLGGVL